MAASLVAQGAVVAVLVSLPRAEPDRRVEVRIVPPARVAPPALGSGPGAPAPPAPARKPKRARRAPLQPPKSLVAPQSVPERPPEPAPPELPEPIDPPAAEEPTGSDGDAGGEGVPGVAGDGTGGGVVGGVPGGGAGGTWQAEEPLEARPADIAMVRARIARTLAYPARAKRLGWQGRVVLAFVLLADGAVRGLHVERTSGYAILDEAALSAVKRATPFSPPGRDVRIEIPVNFDLR